MSNHSAGPSRRRLPDPGLSAVATAGDGLSAFRPAAALALPSSQQLLHARPSGLLVFKNGASDRAPALIDQMRSYLTASEVFGWSREHTGTVLGPAWVDERLSRLPLETSVQFVARMLYQLRSYGADMANADGGLVELLPGPLRERARELLAADATRCFTSPQALMVLLQLAVLRGCSAPAIPPPQILLAVMLAVAENLGASEPATPVGNGAAPGMLGRTVISTQVFYAHPDEDHLLARFNGRWLTACGDGCELADAFREATDVSLEDWATIGFGIWAHVQEHGPQLDPQAFVQSLGWPRARLDAMLDLISADAATLRAEVAAEVAAYGREWAFSPIERYPLLRLQSGELLALDPTLLFKRVFGWLPRFDLSEGLRRAGQRKRAARMVEHLQRHTEDYALAVLRHAAEASAGQTRVYDDVALKAAFARPGQSIADAAVDYGDAWLVIEATTSTLTRKSVAGLTDADVLSDVDKLVEEAAQINATIASLRGDEQRLTGTSPAPHRRFHPLLVVTEGFPVNPITLQLVRERVAAAGLLTDDDVAPLEIVDLIELEVLEAMAENRGTSMLQVLAAKEHASLAAASVRDFVVLEMGEQPGRSTRLESLWQAVIEKTIADTLGVVDL